VEEIEMKVTESEETPDDGIVGVPLQMRVVDPAASVVCDRKADKRIMHKPFPFGEDA
jgi:hypothetical protein